MYPDVGTPIKRSHDRAVQMASGWLAAWALILLSLSYL